MSDTPRTDAVLMYQLRDTAEKLERELTAAKGEIERLRFALTRIAGRCDTEAAYKIAQAALKEPK